MPVAVKMILLLLLLGGLWTQEVNSLETTTTLQTSAPRQSSVSLASDNTEAPKLNSVTSNTTVTRDPDEVDGTRHESSPLSSTPYTVNEVSSPETSIAATSGLSVPEPTTSDEVSTKKSSTLLEISNAASNPAVSAMNSLGFHATTDGTTVTSFLETFSGTSRLPVMATIPLETSSVPSASPVTIATSSLEISSVINGAPVTMKTSSLVTSSVTSGPPVTTAASSLKISDVISGAPVTMNTSSLVTPSVTRGPHVTMATSSLETSKETSGLPVTTTTRSLETYKGTSDTSNIRVKRSTTTTPKTSTSTRSSTPPISSQGKNGTLLVAALVALLVVIVLMALLVLWHQRRKRRTGELMLSSSGKRNGVMDAWAGLARVNDEEAMTATAGVSEGDKGSVAPEGEGSSRRPTLTTFFGRKKSHQGSLALEELQAGSACSLKGEEEPLVGSEDGAVEAPTSDGQKQEL
nr:PREDICTED: leukosialin [Equus przewalskii]